MFVFSLHSRLSLSAVKFFLQLISIALLRLIYFHNLFRGEYFPELIIIFLALSLIHISEPTRRS